MENMQSTKYTISLDDLDLGLLPINFMRKYDKVAPLWINNNLNLTENDYYEFEIKNALRFNEAEEQISNATCYICNIEVPKPFLKQHYDSPRHDVNMKIAETAMERIKKSLKNSVFDNEVEDSSSHFCPTCVTVVKQKEKTKHEKSIMHKNAVIVEKFLQDFYLIYKNDIDNHEKDNLQDNISKNKLINGINNDKKIEIVNIKGTKGKEKDIVNGNGNDSDRNDKCLNKIETGKFIENNSYTETKEEKDSELNKTKKSKKKSVKTKSICNNDFSLNDEDFPDLTPDIKEPLTEYKAEESSVASVLDDENNYFSHIVIRSSKLFCLLCKINFYDKASALTHINGFDHSANYQKILNEQFLIPNDDQTFCTVCNVSFVREMELPHCEDMKHITKHEIYIKRMERLGKN